MAFFTACQFIAKRRIETLQKFIELCNKGASTNELAKFLRVSPSYVARLRKKLLRRHWVPKRAVLDAIELYRRNHEDEAGQARELIESSNLRLLR